jgi:hypothetical protein
MPDGAIFAVGLAVTLLMAVGLLFIVKGVHQMDENREAKR